MRSRQSHRNNTARLRGFKIDSLLERKLKETSDNMELMKPYMTLTFLGFYEKKRECILCLLMLKRNVSISKEGPSKLKFRRTIE